MNDASDLAEWDSDEEVDIIEPSTTGYNTTDGDQEIHDLGGHISPEERGHAEARQDRISQAMWASYQEELRH